MVESINKERVAVDLIAAFSNKSSGDLLPMHELLPSKGQNAIGTIILFKKLFVQPLSRLEFFSDPKMIN